MSLKQVKGCKHLRCSDCGTVEDVGYWTRQDGAPWMESDSRAYNANRTDKTLAPVFKAETMKAAAKRHVKDNHIGQSWHKEDGRTLDELTAELCYVQQCIDWKVVE